MKFQAWLKLQNSASHFTTDLLQMHHDSRSWVHWTQQKFEEDQSFTCMVFREGLSMHRHCQGQGAMWNFQLGISMRVNRPGPIPPAWQGSGQAGEQPEHPQAPRPDVFVVTYKGWGTAGKSASQGPRPGRDGTRLGTGSPTTCMGTVPQAELKWGPL